MSCDCEHRRIGRELERARRLAKAYARLENETVVIVRGDDGSYSFLPEVEETDKKIVEYITPY